MTADLDPLGREKNETVVKCCLCLKFQLTGHLLREAFPDSTPQTRVESLVIDSQSSLIVLVIRYMHHATVSKIHKGLDYICSGHS